MNHEKPDRLFAQEAPASPFTFDKNVVEVFSDMIARSVPGYALSLQMISLLAKDFVKEDTHVYDLGCSLGASMVSVAKGCPHDRYTLIGVDNSPAMIEECSSRLEEMKLRPVWDLLCQDIQGVVFSTSSLFLLNFTLQFIPQIDRLPLLQKIWRSLIPGGALLLSEKISFRDKDTQDKQTHWHHSFKASQGYSALEIAQKRQSLENVLIPEEMTTHITRLEEAGFRHVIPWFQCFNFVSIIAIK